jgi:hypothetical protein
VLLVGAGPVFAHNIFIQAIVLVIDAALFDYRSLVVHIGPALVLRTSVEFLEVAVHQHV